MTQCKSCFKPDAVDFCAACRKELFDSKRVSCYLPFLPPPRNEKDLLLRSILKPSLPRLIIKYPLQLVDKELQQTEGTGTHILKPVPGGNFEKLLQAPANEHLTMQLARQAFKFPVVANALMFFENASGEPAHISHRLYKETDPVKERFDADYEQVHNYEDVASLMKKYVVAYKPMVEQLFALMVFNYLFSNWGARYQNISLVKSEYGDYLLSPAYDLICSALHTGLTYEVLENSLYEGDTNSAGFARNGYHTSVEFIAFAERVGIPDKRAQNIINSFTKNEITISYLVKHSFLDEESKRIYMDLYREKRRRLTS